MIKKYLSQSPVDTIVEFYHNKVVRYFFAAGFATVVDVLIYFTMLHFVLKKQDFAIGSLFVIGAPTISLAVSYSCGLITNFTITKYFVFAESELRGRTQFGRFVLVAAIVLIANYLFMNFLIKVIGIYPTPSRAISAITIGVFSFMAHKAFSFKVGKKNTLEEE